MSDEKQKKSGITTEADGSWQMDLAAFLPDPAGSLKIDGESYPIYNWMDCPVEASMSVIKLADDIDAAKDLDARVSRSIEQILTLNRGPENGRDQRKLLTETQLKRLPLRQLIQLTVMATTVAAVPQKAVVSESDSVSPVLAPAVSTGGPIAS